MPPFCTELAPPLQLPIEPTATPAPTTIPAPMCPASAPNFFQEYVNEALVLGRGPEGGRDCHVNAQIPSPGGGDIINFHIKYDKAGDFFFAIVTGIIGMSLPSNNVWLGANPQEAAGTVVHDLAGILGVLANEGGFDSAVQLYGRLFPRLVGALTTLMAVS